VSHGTRIGGVISCLGDEDRALAARRTNLLKLHRAAAAA
jgi:hypothetical protein